MPNGIAAAFIKYAKPGFKASFIAAVAPAQFQIRSIVVFGQDDIKPNVFLFNNRNAFQRFLPSLFMIQFYGTGDFFFVSGFVTQFFRQQPDDIVFNFVFLIAGVGIRSQNADCVG